jgi:ATP-binding cassette subfamily B multidrug efflux pump
MFRRFERLIDPTRTPVETPPPQGLLAFFWHYAQQVRGPIAGLFVGGLFVALLDASIPICIGRVAGLVATMPPGGLLRDAWPQLAVMGLIVLVLRPGMVATQAMLVNQAINPGFSNLIRWQSHWNVVRQSWTFFQNDFAGRIANRVLQTGPALREVIVSAVDSVWYILVVGGSAVTVLASTDYRLALPILAWFATYAVLLRAFVPRLRDRSRHVAEVRSGLTGRIVDAYTNILTVKLFAKPRDEDAFVRESVDEHTAAFRAQTRMISTLILSLTAMNAVLLVGMAALAITLWSQGRIAVGLVATAMALAWQITNTAGWVARSVTAIFENVGIVQDGMRSIAVPRQMPDRPGAVELQLVAGEIRFERVQFGYGAARGVLHGIDLAVAPGERIGLVGASGAGKSTLVNLLLGFYTPEAGRILIDGQDIAGVTQETLRAEIAMVTQDTSLLHRSIRDNIRYGRPTATQAEVEAAARRAQAHDFILELEDWQGRRGYDAHVGERGVKLSGGQRQRIAIARVILKDAPILVLDEATSALDSEVEAAIQEQLDALMQGRTVIAIAHRLSTIARMDRLLLLDQGRILEQGTHAELLARGGAYARAWTRQSLGFEAAV